MTEFVMPLLLDLDVASLTMSLVNIASPSGAEAPLADSLEAALGAVSHLSVSRTADTVLARTDAGQAERVLVHGQLATAPVEGDPLAYVEMGRLVGPGAASAKGALAVALRAAAAGGFGCDVTFVFGSVDVLDPHALRADVAVLARPTGCAVVGDVLDHPRACALVQLTDVAPVHRPVGGFGAPSVEFGPGDPAVGDGGEFVGTAALGQAEFVLRTWLSR